MLRNVLDNRMAVIGAVVALSLILSGSVVGIHSAISAEGDAWPAFTMTYEVDGTAIGVGDATYQGREVHRLEYRTGKGLGRHCHRSAFSGHCGRTCQRVRIVPAT